MNVARQILDRKFEGVVTSFDQVRAEFAQRCFKVGTSLTGKRRIKRKGKLATYRDVVMELYYDGVSYSGIAEEFQVSRQSVYQFIRRELDETGYPSRDS